MPSNRVEEGRRLGQDRHRISRDQAVMNPSKYQSAVFMDCRENDAMMGSVPRCYFMLLEGIRKRTMAIVNEVTETLVSPAQHFPLRTNRGVIVRRQCLSTLILPFHAERYFMFSNDRIYAAAGNRLCLME